MTTVRELKNVETIAIVDDNVQAREAMAEAVIDAKLKPYIQEKRLSTVKELIKILTQNADAVVCDHQLTPRNYAAFQGAEAVSALYDISFPAILITAFSNEDVDIIRRFRRKIPVIIRGGSLDSQTLMEFIRQCQNEFNNHFVKERQPWRVIIRIQEVDASYAFAIVPSWDSKAGLKLPLSIFPAHCGKIVQGMRLFAEVNIGASKAEDLYFDNFEVAEKPK